MEVSHHMLCPCGKSILYMNEQQQALYYVAISNRSQTRSINKRAEDRPIAETPVIENVIPRDKDQP